MFCKFRWTQTICWMYLWRRWTRFCLCFLPFTARFSTPLIIPRPTFSHRVCISCNPHNSRPPLFLWNIQWIFFSVHSSHKSSRKKVSHQKEPLLVWIDSLQVNPINFLLSNLRKSLQYLKAYQLYTSKTKKKQESLVCSQKEDFWVVQVYCPASVYKLLCLNRQFLRECPYNNMINDSRHSCAYQK